MKLVITGDAETGKTTLTHILKCQFPLEIALMPDPLDLLKSSSLPEASSFYALKSQQKVLYYLHKELENLVSESVSSPLIICDHGTLDCLKNWPGSAQSFFEEVGSTLQMELDRYAWVVQITRRPTEPAQFTSSSNLDPQDFWSFHPRRFVISPEIGFSECMQKLSEIVAEILKTSFTIPKRIHDGSSSIEI